jgi:hypothetical protein
MPPGETNARKTSPEWEKELNGSGCTVKGKARVKEENPARTRSCFVPGEDMLLGDMESGRQII